MTSSIHHLAVAAESYAVGSYLLLQFGRGTQVCRIEGATKGRYRIRRFENRLSDHAAWDHLTSLISKSDERIIGEIAESKLAGAQVLPCPTLKEWEAKLIAAAVNCDAKAAEELELHAAGGTTYNHEWCAKKASAAAAKFRKEAAAIAALIPAPETATVADLPEEAQAEELPAAEELEDNLPAIEAPELPEVAPAIAARMVSDALNNPTRRQYGELDTAYDFFNETLFGGELPRCLITMQRAAKMYGFFHAKRFSSADGSQVADEIALNPEHLRDRTPEQSLSTLVHEMAHAWDEYHGKPSRAGYHSKSWAAKMEEIGLMPSSTGEAGGKKTGQKVSHYIIDGGPFACRCRDLIAGGWVMPYVQTPSPTKEAKAKKASKTKFTCPCCSANAWAKPNSKLICGECVEAMEPEQAEEPAELEEA